MIAQVIDRGQIEFTAHDGELGDITDPDRVRGLNIKLAVQLIVCNMTRCSAVGGVAAFDPDFRFQGELVHELEDQFLGGLPSCLNQQDMDTPIPVTGLILVE